MRLTVIGIGSPFGEDTLGWALLDALEAQGLGLPGWEITWRKADRPGPGLLHWFEEQDAAVLVDTPQGDVGPTGVRMLALDELARSERPLSIHAMGVAETLALGERLRILPQRPHILGVDAGKRLSPEIAAHAGSLIEAVIAPRANRLAHVPDPAERDA